MCQIIVKPEGKKVNFRKLDIAQKKNQDGYGVTWYDEDTETLQTFKTMNYNRFKAILSTLKYEAAVIHLRKTSKGDTCIDNNHPFDIPSGVMFHNGTIHNLSCSTEGGSDTKALADLISECTYSYIDDIMPFIKEKIGDKYNKLVFFETDGVITIINKELGVEEDGIWYSNTYHHTKQPVKTTNYSYSYNYKTQEWEPVNSPKTVNNFSKPMITDSKAMDSKTAEKTQKVFVYGTLKKGFGNNILLKDSNFIGECTTLTKYLMIGKNMAFPYIITQDVYKGKQIKGELYEVDTQVLEKLDRLEGVPTHYKRTLSTVKIGDVYHACILYMKSDEKIPEWATGLDYIDEFVSNVSERKSS